MKYLLIFLCLPLLSVAQSSNDNINKAKVLNIGESSTSSTAYNTIQSSCVNYALTKKCIKYHNDQWFIVNPKGNDFLYINIQDQECRDLLGVQLVAIDGEACDIKNYKLVECVSFPSNDDFYVRLDSLEPFKDYLINIDGYLHDFCSFSITPDTIPYGIPPAVNLDLNSEKTIYRGFVSLKWILPEDQNNFSHFEVLRRSDGFKHEFLAKIPLLRNSYGSLQRNYEYVDTLDDNKEYHYKLLAIDQSGKKYLFDEFSVRGPDQPENSKIELTLYYPESTPLIISLYDKKTDKLLRRSRIVFQKEDHRSIRYKTAYIKEKGIDNVIVEIKNERTGLIQRKEYPLD